MYQYGGVPVILAFDAPGTRKCSVGSAPGTLGNREYSVVSALGTREYYSWLLSFFTVWYESLKITDSRESLADNHWLALVLWRPSIIYISRFMDSGSVLVWVGFTYVLAIRSYVSCTSRAVLGIRMGLSAPMADRPYCGFSSPPQINYETYAVPMQDLV